MPCLETISLPFFNDVRLHPTYIRYISVLCSLQISIFLPLHKVSVRRCPNVSDFVGVLLQCLPPFSTD